MSRSKHVFETPAILYLKTHGVASIEYTYDYVDKGDTTESSRQLGVGEYHAIETLAMKDEHVEPLIVLMHSDRSVSTRNLARQTGRRSVQPYKLEVMQWYDGYLAGGTSPFGVRETMPVYVEANVLEFERIYTNGGRRGFLVSLVPNVLTTMLNARPVNCVNSD